MRVYHEQTALYLYEYDVRGIIGAIHKMTLTLLTQETNK